MRWIYSSLVLMLGVLSGCGPSQTELNQAQQRLIEVNREHERLKEELQQVRGLLPDQAHAMQDVGYHFTNLWFAAQGETWELAKFNLAETKSPLRWAVRIIPVRKLSGGGELALGPVLDAFVKNDLFSLERTLEARDKKAFEEAYQTALKGCMSCHTASEKAFIKLKVPTEPAASLLDYNYTPPSENDANPSP